MTRDPETLCRVSEDLRAKEFKDSEAELRDIERQRRKDASIAELIDGFEQHDGNWVFEIWRISDSRIPEFLSEIEHLVFQGDLDTALIDIKRLFEVKHREAAERIAGREEE